MTWLSRLVGRDGRSPTAADAAAQTAQTIASGVTGTRLERGTLATGLEIVERISIPLRIAEETQRSLRAAGRDGNEGLVLWSGLQDGVIFAVRTLTMPRQRAIRSAEGICVVVDGDGLHQVNVETFRRGERLLAQVHSHPGRAYHSAMDDRYAVVTSPGGLSLVVPDFAIRPFSLGECAIFRLAKSGAWRKVPSREAEGLISVSDR